MALCHSGLKTFLVLRHTLKKGGRGIWKTDCCYADQNQYCPKHFQISK